VARSRFTNTWALLDLTPNGRQEIWQEAEVPAGRPQSPPYHWWPEPDRCVEEFHRNQEIRAARG
jgi:predicted dithiol-disulfide oxidoreductase (DUF899 family)